MKIPFTITTNNITLFHKGKMFNIPNTFRKFSELKEHLLSGIHELEFIESIVNVRDMIERASKGEVKIFGSEVYYRNKPIRNSLTERLVSMLDKGYDIGPWIAFMDNVMQNPSEDSRNRLFDFLEKNNSPFTEDGHFLAFKRVAGDFLDLYTHTMDNSPGKIVEMERERVNADNSVTCSHGLHVAASIYLNSYASADGNKTIVCKVNPRDVVAVPPDYNETKMRVCRYEVLSEVEVGSINEIESQEVFVEEKPVVEEIVVLGNKEELSDIQSFVRDELVESGLGYDDVVIEVDYNWDDNGNDNLQSIRITLVFDNVDHWKDRAKNIEDYIELTKSVGFDLFELEDGIEEINFFAYLEDEDLNIDLEKFEIDDSGATSNISDLYKDVLEYLEYEAESEFKASNGTSYTSKEILDGVAKFGSITQWAKSEGIPRSTAQGWVKRITA